eukprot:ANDGO_02160.mRNA.1 hypothetical protein
MCIVILKKASDKECSNGSPVYILLNNRDERGSRASEFPRLHANDDGHVFFAGRDLEKGGTWFGVDDLGRFAILTNVPNLELLAQPAVQGDLNSSAPVNVPSRGQIVWSFLANQSMSLNEYANVIQGSWAVYPGFCLLYGDLDHALFLSHASSGDSLPGAVADGIHCFSNSPQMDDYSWKKIRTGSDLLRDALKSLPALDSAHEIPATVANVLFEVLQSKSPPPSTPFLDDVFVHMEGYCTRCSIITFVWKDRVRCLWREYSMDGLRIVNHGTESFAIEKRQH